MAHPHDHARSSARKYGGVPEDYEELHSWFDQTKQFCTDPRHRVILHNSFGIFLCEQVFGVTFQRLSDAGTVRTRLIGEQHIREDFGGIIPTLNDIIDHIHLEPWMGKNPLKLSQLLEEGYIYDDTTPDVNERIP